MGDAQDERRQRRVAADFLLESLAEQEVALSVLAEELRRGRSARVRARERIEDVGGHEADTVFGSWLDTDDRITAQLERWLEASRRAAEATRAHIAATELLLFELEPGHDDPRGDGSLPPS